MLSPYFQLLVTFQNNSPWASSFTSLALAPGEARGFVGSRLGFLKDTQGDCPEGMGAGRRTSFPGKCVPGSLSPPSPPPLLPTHLV